MQNYLSQGENYITNQFNRLLTPVQIGQASAAGSAANTLNSASQVGNAIGQMGDIRAATILGGRMLVLRWEITCLAVSVAVSWVLDCLAALELLAADWAVALSAHCLDFPTANTSATSSRQAKTKTETSTGSNTCGAMTFMKAMADELRTVRPDAVVELDGALLVSDEFMPRKVA